VTVQDTCIVQYTYRIETAEENIVVLNNDSPTNKLCDRCQAFHFKAVSSAGSFTSQCHNALIRFSLVLKYVLTLLPWTFIMFYFTELLFV
jgi:hypothetical protein